MRVLVSLLVLIALTGVVYCQVPIPPRPPGFVLLDSQHPEVVLEVFYDFLCDDSAASWPILKMVMDTYRDKGVKILVHIFPLPFHHNAFFMQMAGEVVREQSEMFFEFIEVSFMKQTEFLTGAVNLTEPQVQSKIAVFTEGVTKVSRLSVMEGFKSKDIDTRARTAWKYGCHRGITGTPQFIINGVHDPTAPDLDYRGWERVIDRLKAMN